MFARLGTFHSMLQKIRLVSHNKQKLGECAYVRVCVCILMQIVILNHFNKKGFKNVLVLFRFWCLDNLLDTDPSA